MYRVLSFVCAVFISVQAMTQPAYTLQQCIDSAQANYIPVKRSNLAAQSAQVNLNQARANLLPNLIGDFAHGLYFGRSIDPTSNTYVDQQFNYANYGVQSGVTVFSGLSLQNNIKSNAYAYEASRMDLQQTKDNLTLNVILAYLQVLNNEDQLALALQQADVSQKQLDRLKILNDKGAVKPSDISDLTGQLMDNQLSVVNARNALQTAKLTLSQYMVIPYNPDMKVQRLDVQQLLNTYTTSAADVYQNALNQFSLVKSAELRAKSFEYAYKASRGQLFPTLSIGGGAYTRYSSVPQGNTKTSYGDQVANNLNYGLGFDLSIPIFNRFLYRNRMKLAKITWKDYQLAEENTKVQLRQDVEQAYLNMTNALNRYKVLQEQVAAYEESFQAAEVRFNAGVGTSIDYLTVKNRLDIASINLINAKYEFVLRKKILDYYQNNK
jgi:outer membrane protein